MTPTAFHNIEVAAHGLKVGCRVAGQGSNILLLPGWGGSTVQYLPLMDALASLGYRTVMPELPGVPSSGAAEASIRTDNWDDWVDTIARVTMKTPFLLLSHSLSATISLQYVSAAKLNCRGSILLAPWLFSSAPEAAFWRLVAHAARPLAPVIYPDMRWLRDARLWRTALLFFSANRRRPKAPCLVLMGKHDIATYLFSGWKTLGCETRKHDWGHSPQIRHTRQLAAVIDEFSRCAAEAA